MTASSRMIYIGIDPSGGPRRIAYAALEEDLRPLALGRGNLKELLAFIGGQPRVVVGINAPPRPNRGLMAKARRREALSPPPPAGRWEDCRLAEYELIARGLRVFTTPGKEADCRAWMRAGFELYGKLDELGYENYPAERAEKQLLEVSTLAAYAAWLGRAPFRKYTLEGRLQRQVVLQDFELDVPNPMRFFEEITRHRLLRGELPRDILYSAPELEALAAALAARWAVKRPEEVSFVGDLKEGQILVPTKALLESFA